MQYAKARKKKGFTPTHPQSSEELHKWPMVQSHRMAVMPPMDGEHFELSTSYLLRILPEIVKYTELKMMMKRVMTVMLQPHAPW